MADDDQSMADNKWHLDRRVPVAIILALLGQTLAAVWWLSGLDGRVTVLERASAIATVSAPVQADRLTRVESKVESLQRDASEIKTDVKSLLRGTGR